jgi:two-component system, OmpR family, sensor histidine kinase MtrB
MDPLGTMSAPAGAVPGAARRGHRLRLRFRTAAALALVGLVVSVSLGLIAYELARTYLVDKRLELVQREALLNAQFIDAALSDGRGEVRTVLGEVSEQVRPVLVEADGTWFGTVVGVGRDRVPASLVTAVDAGGAAVHVGAGEGGAPTAVVGVALPRSGAGFYQLFALDELAATLDAIRTSLVIAAVLSTAAAALIGLLVSRRVLSPLRATAAAARRITGGDMSARLDDRDDRDLMPLVESFNEMAAALDARIQRERRFAADVSHELRTPLTALTSAVHIVDRRADALGPTGRQAVDVLRSQLEQFKRLVLEILDLSRLEAGTADVQVESVDLRHVLAAVLGECDLPASALSVDADVPERVGTDPRRLRIILRNLLENADRYAGGCVRLGVGRAGDLLVLEVDDHGDGVPEEEREGLFERFRRGTAASAPDAPKGTGLGLSLVAENVRALDGRVDITDVPGGGARFRVALPLPVPADGPTAPPQLTSPPEVSR